MQGGPRLLAKGGQKAPRWSLFLFDPLVREFHYLSAGLPIWLWVWRFGGAGKEEAPGCEFSPYTSLLGLPQTRPSSTVKGASQGGRTWGSEGRERVGLGTHVAADLGLGSWHPPQA